MLIVKRRKQTTFNQILKDIHHYNERQARILVYSSTGWEFSLRRNLSIGLWYWFTLIFIHVSVKWSEHSKYIFLLRESHRPCVGFIEQSRSKNGILFANKIYTNSIHKPARNAMYWTVTIYQAYIIYFLQKINSKEYLAKEDKILVWKSRMNDCVCVCSLYLVLEFRLSQIFETQTL